MEFTISIFLGIGLAAAVGFRVFVPFLLISVAHYAGFLTLTDGFAWIGTTPALIAFSIATAIEIAAYFVPVLDNFLDMITAPLAVIGGTVLMSSAVGEIDPFLQWTIAIIAGGGTAGLIKGLTSAGRAGSTVGTGGLANPVISSGESIGAILLTALSFAVPYIAAGMVILLLLVALPKLWRRFSRKTN